MTNGALTHSNERVAHTRTVFRLQASVKVPISAVEGVRAERARHLAGDRERRGRAS